MNTEKNAADWFARMNGPDAADARDEFAIWYADPDHAAAYDHLARTWDQAKFLANTPTGRARNLDLARPRFGTHRRTIALGASLMLGVVLCVALVVRVSQPGPIQVGARTETRTTSSGEGRRVIALADGSRIILDRASRLDIAFTVAERRLRLRVGRARFDVAHDLVRPFVVAAGGASVIAHGTMFDVAFELKGVAVVLLRGAVEVRGAASGIAPTSVRHLVPGQKVMLSGGTLSAPIVAPARDTQWVQPMIEFDATPLGDAVTLFNRAGGRPDPRR
jgi:transmembrane sensor